MKLLLDANIIAKKSRLLEPAFYMKQPKKTIS